MSVQTRPVRSGIHSVTAGPWLRGLVLLALVWGTKLQAGQGFQRELEPNNSSGTATPLSGTNLVVRAHIFPSSDVDYYSFSASAGDRVYAATMTGFSAATDSTVTLFNTDGTTILEIDGDDGAFTTLASSIAGAVLPAAGTYFLRVGAAGITQMRPYDLHFQLRGGSPTAETEPNSAPAQALPASGWVSGVISSSGETDAFRVALNAGDSVFLSLDLDPERDLDGAWNGNVGISAIGGANPIARADSSGTTNPFSEAFFWTVNATGNYDIHVSGTGGTSARTYNLSVSVHPNTLESSNCTTYANAVSTPIGPGPGIFVSTITIPDLPGVVRIADLDVSINLTHSGICALDVQLISPVEFNQNSLFTDLAQDSGCGPATMSLRLDDEAAIPITSFSSPFLGGMAYQPDAGGPTNRDYRLSWFDGELAEGDWTLAVYNDNSGGGDIGTLNSWSITVCAAPQQICPAGSTTTTLYTQDFEANNGGYTGSPTSLNWFYGVPLGEVIVSCSSGSKCWKTGSFEYAQGISEDLISVGIPIPVPTPPSNTVFIASWTQKLQMDTASDDHVSVDVRHSDNTNPRRLFEHLDDVMRDSVGSPTTTIEESAGWGLYRADITSYAGQTVELVFHIDSAGTSGSSTFDGLAIDDVTVTKCEGPVPVELLNFHVE